MPGLMSRWIVDVPMRLDHLVRKAVALDPRLRFETAEETLLALERGAARALPAPGHTSADLQNAQNPHES